MEYPKRWLVTGMSNFLATLGWHCGEKWGPNSSLALQAIRKLMNKPRLQITLLVRYYVPLLQPTWNSGTSYYLGLNLLTIGPRIKQLESVLLLSCMVWILPPRWIWQSLIQLPNSVSRPVIWQLILNPSINRCTIESLQITSISSIVVTKAANTSCFNRVILYGYIYARKGFHWNVTLN